MLTKTPTEEAVCEIRNAYTSHAYVVRELRDGRKTETSAIIELEKLWQRVGLALKMLREVGL